MFSHLLAGELIFLVLGYFFGFDISVKYLVFGAFCGIMPDVLSHIFSGRLISSDKWYHKHRDNFSHSLFFPILIFISSFFWIDARLAFTIALAVASHAFFDLWGIGWGVKLFLPVSGSVFKMFYKKRLVYRFKNEKEREADVKKHGKDDWFKIAYFFAKPSKWLKWWGVFEWASLAVAVFLPILYFFI